MKLSYFYSMVTIFLTEQFNLWFPNFVFCRGQRLDPQMPGHPPIGSPLPGGDHPTPMATNRRRIGRPQLVLVYLQP